MQRSLNPSPNQRVLAIGELLWDVLPTGKLLGGAPANCCFRLGQLGVSARMASRIGSDTLGDEMAEALRAKGFNLSLVQRDETLPTGTVDVFLRDDGSPDFTINPGVAYDNLEATDELLAAAKESALICFGTLIQRTPRARASLYTILDTATESSRFLDINLRKDCYSKETVMGSLERATILKLNSGEVATVAQLIGLSASSERERVAEMLHHFELESVLVTRGEQGVYALHRNGDEVELPGIAVQVVDTIGSGDSFSAGFIARRLVDAPLKECCYFGNINGALNASRKGGMPDISTAEVEEFAAEHPLR